MGCSATCIFGLQFTSFAKVEREGLLDQHVFARLQRLHAVGKVAPKYDVIRQLMEDGVLGDLHTLLADHGEYFTTDHRATISCGMPPTISANEVR
jgi:hypothetical protein